MAYRLPETVLKKTFTEELTEEEKPIAFMLLLQLGHEVDYHPLGTPELDERLRKDDTAARRNNICTSRQFADFYESDLAMEEQHAA